MKDILKKVVRSFPDKLKARSEESNTDFTMTRSGRNGCIIYKSDDKNLEIYWEMSGVPEYDMLLAPVDLREWKLPQGRKNTEK